MGFYTKLKFSAQLNSDAPIDFLDKLINTNYIEEIANSVGIKNIYSVHDFPRLLEINHDFGKTDRWESVIQCASFDKERKVIKVDCDLKAYDGLYDKFTDWLRPYIVSGSWKEMNENEECWTVRFFDKESKNFIFKK